MKPYPDLDTASLLHFNREVLAQAQALVAAHDAPTAPPYAGPVGSHLRHTIEHYEALLNPAQPGRVDYDRRARDALLERCARTAALRLQALQDRLAETLPDPQQPLAVRARVGLAGAQELTLPSTFGRELLFVASHAVHHHALLAAHCRQHGITVDADFGKAPATVAHSKQEISSCLPTSLSA